MMNTCPETIEDLIATPGVEVRLRSLKLRDGIYYEVLATRYFPIRRERRGNAVMLVALERTMEEAWQNVRAQITEAMDKSARPWNWSQLRVGDEEAI